jgi:predicted ATPase
MPQNHSLPRHSRTRRRKRIGIILVIEGPRHEAVISTPDRRLRVFVSSSLAELGDERRAVSRAVSALRLTPVMFEQGARPHSPRDVYRAYLAQSDVFIGLYWQRYGQAAAGMGVSGLEEEFDLSAGLPRLLYIKEPAPSREPGLARLLDRIKEQASISYRHFGGAAELGRLVRDDLAALLSERFASASVSPRAASGRSRALRPLPVSTTTLVGRDQAIGDVVGLLTRPGVRLVTLTGPGGVGKTRLAMAVGERLRECFAERAAFASLAAVTDPGQVLSAIARAVGADLAGTPLEAVADRLGDERWLLILDNLEQVVGAGADLGELLARCPGVVILATSRTVLGLRAEREYPVFPLPAGSSAEPSEVPVDELMTWPAVALFADRAQGVRPDFTLTAGNAAAVAEICRRLEGLPLAIELAAARIRLLDPGALLARLDSSLDALGAGPADLPGRQHTLRATVEWSVGLLDDAERSLLEITSVFVDGWTIEAAAQVAGLDEDTALELSEALARHSLIYVDGGSSSRPRMLETIRAFVAERLAARPDESQIRRRHADYYRSFAERADPALRRAAHGQCLEHLEADAGNLAAAVGWYLGHDRGLLPHLLRVLWPFWFLRDPMSEARTWIGQLLPTVGSFAPQARAELLWTAAVSAVEVGDDTTALAARQQLAALQEVIEDPFLHAVSQLAIAWAAPITGDFDSAFRAASAALEELRSQDEPLWTALAAGTLGSMQTTAGQCDDALSNLQEVRELADRLDSAWLAAWSRTQLGIVAILQDRREQARELLDQALTRSVAAHSTGSVTLCLMAYARLALADDEPEQAALLAGAACGLRQRAGLRAWPMLRQGEAELITQIRHAQDPGQFSKITAAGSRLTKQQAVEAIDTGLTLHRNGPTWTREPRAASDWEALTPTGVKICPATS